MRTSTSAETRLHSGGAKRILALDGGGIRGIVSLMFLKRVEELLRKRFDRPDLTLSSYFDLIGGTSTGSIIAAGLATGMTVDELIGLYTKLGNTVFASKWYRKGLLIPKFSVKPLRKELERQFGDITFESDRLQCGLAVVVKRADTNSVWLVTNNIRDRYFSARKEGSAVGFSSMRLRDVVQASCAAPTYFRPERLKIARSNDKDVQGVFVDGGVSPFNNPALLLFRYSVLPSYGLKWTATPEQLFLLSVGTGSRNNAAAASDLTDGTPAELGIRGLSSIMNDCAELCESMLQWLSNSPTARAIDRAMDVQDATICEPKLAYVRYQLFLERDWLSEYCGVSYDDEQLDRLAQMDNPENVQRLAGLAGHVTNSMVLDLHFPPAFDDLN